MPPSEPRADTPLPPSELNADSAPLPLLAVEVENFATACSDLASALSKLPVSPRNAISKVEIRAILYLVLPMPFPDAVMTYKRIGGSERHPCPSLPPDRLISIPAYSLA